VLGAASACFAFACGGTTGHEGLPQPEGGTATVDGGLDATAVFDAPIMYADRELPDIVAPPDTGSAGGGDAGLSCPPWAPVLCNGPPLDPETCHGNPSPYGSETDFVPAQYDDAGNVLVDDAGVVVLYPADSGCGSYPWLGSTDIDNCAGRNYMFEGIPILPPCNWCTDAGLAKSGPGQGQPRYGLCEDLYACMLRTGCAIPYPQNCLCGQGATTNNCMPTGPCAMEELAALQSESDPASIQATLQLYFTTATESSANPNHGYCGSILNAVFQGAISGMCFPDAGP
jgi:hypothetical protein